MTLPSYLESSNPRVPKADFPFRHSIPVQIRFSDVDMLGHLNNNVYLSLFDLAKLRYFSAVYGTDVTATHLCLVVVNINCNFLAPAFLNDSLEVWTRVVSIGHQSIKLEQRMVERSTGEIKCIANTVMAGFDPQSMAGQPIQQEQINLLEKFEQHSLQNV